MINCANLSMRLYLYDQFLSVRIKLLKLVLQNHIKADYFFKQSIQNVTPRGGNVDKTLDSQV